MRRRGLRSLLLFLLPCWLLALPGIATAVTLDGESYLPLANLASRFGMEAFTAGDDRVIWKSRWSRLSFAEHRRDFIFNDIKVHLGAPVREHRSQLFVSARDYAKTVRPLLSPQVFTPAPGLRTIVIDPGHGGKDPGAQNRELGLHEKLLCLDLAKRLERRLEGMGYRVLLTRDRDIFLPLEARSARANQLGADLFLSLHLNAFGNPSVNGIETFIFTPQDQPSTGRRQLHRTDRDRYPGNRWDEWNVAAGHAVHRALVLALQAEDRGLKRARFTVLRDLDCPGMLIEGGFISNPAEARRLASSSYRERLAAAIAQGVRDYAEKLLAAHQP